VMVRDDEFQQYRNIIAKDKVLVVDGGVSPDDYSGGLKMSASRILDIDQAREHYARRLVVHLDSARCGNGLLPSLGQALEPFRAGQCPVLIDYLRSDARGLLLLGEEWRVHPADALLARLREVAGPEAVRVEYH